MLSKWAVLEKEQWNSEHNNTVDRYGFFSYAGSIVFWWLFEQSSIAYLDALE